MRKWTTAIVCVLLLCLLVLPVGAAGTAEFTVTADKTNVHSGDVITYTVSVSTTEACTSFDLLLQYDKAVFELVSGKVTVSGATITDFDNVSFLVGYSSATVPSGAVAEFKLKVKDSATGGSASVTVDPVVKNENATVSSAAKAVNMSVTAHSYDDSCDKDCNTCGATRTITHTWDAGQVQEAADCKTGKEGSVLYTCSVCGEKKTEKVAPTHNYDENWQNDAGKHWHLCKVCGAAGTATEHKPGAWQGDGQNHWRNCEDCGVLMDKAAHTPGKEPTEYKGQNCTVCNRELKPALGHTCQFSEEWQSDDNGHWHECSGCEDMDAYGAHVYDNDCDKDCNICGYERNPEHIYSEHWTSDATGHWHECTLCGEPLELVPHQSGPEATDSTAQICLICGYEIAPALSHNHTFGEEWQKDDQSHWHQCDCGEASEKEAHSWDEGVVTREPTDTVVGRKTYTCQICGAERSENMDVPGTDDSTGDKPGFPWFIVAIIVGVAVIAVGVYVIVGVVKGKKQSGRFTK